MTTVNIEAESMIRNHVQYYLKNMVDDELEKLISKAKQDLEKMLRDTAATAALTLVRSSRVDMVGSEVVVRLELPDLPTQQREGDKGVARKNL